MRAGRPSGYSTHPVVGLESCPSPWLRAGTAFNITETLAKLFKYAKYFSMALVHFPQLNLGFGGFSSSSLYYIPTHTPLPHCLEFEHSSPLFGCGG